eukprot:1005828-Prymnesium_polylepis.1
MYSRGLRAARTSAHAPCLAVVPRVPSVSRNVFTNGEYSTHDFYGHDAAAISLAIVTGETEAI